MVWGSRCSGCILPMLSVKSEKNQSRSREISMGLLNFFSNIECTQKIGGNLTRSRVTFDFFKHMQFLRKFSCLVKALLSIYFKDRSDGSSSNSDSDSSTPPKRPRASRTVRGVRSKRPILQEKPGVYATKVQTGLANLKTGFLTTVAKTLKENTGKSNAIFLVRRKKQLWPSG